MHEIHNSSVHIVVRLAICIFRWCCLFFAGAAISCCWHSAGAVSVFCYCHLPWRLYSLICIQLKPEKLLLVLGYELMLNIFFQFFVLPLSTWNAFGT